MRHVISVTRYMLPESTDAACSGYNTAVGKIQTELQHEVLKVLEEEL